jgi:hypothetical protein
MKYKGWKISYFPEGSQVWKAVRYGVRMRANSKELLLSMIDTRDSDNNQGK